MSRRVLIVDDEPVMRMLMQDWLEAAGYYVATLDRPEGVPASIAAQRPDLVILDYMMPGRSGGDVAGELEARGCRVPLLFVTALSVSLDSLRHHALLRKPFDDTALVAAVQAIIGPAEDRRHAAPA